MHTPQVNPGRARVLIVDDDDLVLAVMDSQLSKTCDCRTISDSREALAIVAQGGLDVIVSDQIMPHLTGDELLAQVYERWPEVERLLITGHADLKSVMRAVNNGKIFSFLVKPWTADDLTRAVDGAYHRALTARALREGYDQVCEECARALTELSTRPPAAIAPKRGLIPKSIDPRQILSRRN